MSHCLFRFNMVKEGYSGQLSCLITKLLDHDPAQRSRAEDAFRSARSVEPQQSWTMAQLEALEQRGQQCIVQINNCLLAELKLVSKYTSSGWFALEPTSVFPRSKSFFKGVKTSGTACGTVGIAVYSFLTSTKRLVVHWGVPYNTTFYPGGSRCCVRWVDAALLNSPNKRSSQSDACWNEDLKSSVAVDSLSGVRAEAKLVQGGDHSFVQVFVEEVYDLKRAV